MDAVDVAEHYDHYDPAPADSEPVEGRTSLIDHLAVVDVADLRTYHRNPRKGSVPAIRRSLEVNRQYRPIVVNRGTHTGRPAEVLAGNHTLLAARDLRWQTLAVVWVDVDEDQAARIVAADNRTADLGTYDDRLLLELLADLPDLDGTGYDPGDLDELARLLDDDSSGAGGSSGLNDPDDTPEPPAEPYSRPGDLWLLGPHRLLCGDATNPEHLALVTDGVEPGIVYTDPPYGISIVNDDSGKVGHAVGTPFGGTKKGSKPFGNTNGKVIHTTKYLPVAGDDSTDAARAAFTLLRSSYPKARHVWWGGNHYVASAALPDASCWLVWDKETGDNTFADAELAWTNHPGAVRMFRHMWNGMLRATERGKRVHPTQKPVALAEWAFTVVDGKDEHRTVLDVFAGSGSTLIAAERTRRTAMLIEMEPAYVDVILKRYKDHTGIVPTNAATGEAYDG